MTSNHMPRTVDKAIDLLMAKLSLREKIGIAKMDKLDLGVLNMTLGPYIRDEFGLLKGNQELLESCRILSGRDDLHMDVVPAIIIRLLWATLRRTHSVRVVK